MADMRLEIADMHFKHRVRFTTESTIIGTAATTAWYGYYKNHKKRAKIGQKRTRERKEYTKAGNLSMDVESIQRLRSCAWEAIKIEGL
nr:hypothetical protein [Tanacetum cinerariifolium]GFB31640.1 hypothetical protein [Tanacetum cinerariifolium]